MSNPLVQIRARIDQFLEELDVLVRRAAMESIRDALDGSAPAAPAGGAPPRRRGRSARASKAGAKAGRPAGASNAADPRKPGRPLKATAGAAKPAAGKPGRRKRRSSDDVAEVSNQIQAFVASNPGSGLAAMTAALKRPSKDLKQSLKLLVASKVLRTEGQRRTTRYFVKA